jgi:hypothetical protein
MRRRLIIAVVSSAIAVGGLSLGSSTPAFATCGVPDVCTNTSAVSATLQNTLGTRSVASVAPITMTNATQATTLSTTWDSKVAEVSRTGTNSWSIQATLSGGQLTYASSNHIPASAFVLSGNTASVVAGGGGTWSAGAGGALNDDGATGTPLCANSGQSTGSTYTGTYDCTGTITLTPPNGTVQGAYAGTFVVTLID